MAVLAFMLVATTGFSQNAWTTTEICIPNVHVDSCKLKLPFEDTRSLRAEFVLDLILGQDSVIKNLMLVNTENELVTKVSVRAKGKKSGQDLMSEIAIKFSKPVLVNQNVVFALYQWEYPKGVVNSVKHHKIKNTYTFVSKV